MFERKYYYARVAGNPQDILYKINSAVVNANLAAYVPLVKMERPSGREFYIFLGVEYSGIGLPWGLGETLRSLGIRFEEDWPLKLDEIETFALPQDIHIHGFNSLEYRRRQLDSPGDPYDRSDNWQPIGASAEMCSLYELLLYWISSRGQGNWDNFVQACLALKIADNRREARSAFRRMTLLGHIDSSGDGLKWSVSPLAFVRFPDQEEGGYLTGQRTPNVLDRASNLWSLTQTQQMSYDGPHRVSFSPARSIDSGVEAGIDVAEAGISSVRLASLLPDLQGWKDSLHSLPSLSTLPYHLEKWTSGKFETYDTLYERDGIHYGESGMYRLSGYSGQSTRNMTLFFDKPSQRWLRGDWYGLRFMDLEAGQKLIEVVHDSDSGTLLIPNDQRWPLLYERALTFASGLLPSRAGNPDWLSYIQIPLSLAEMLCSKLNVVLLEK